jgi:hypothetical protein
MLPPIDTIQNIKDLQLNIIDILEKKDKKAVKFFINDTQLRYGCIVAQYYASEIKTPDRVELTMKRVKNGDFNIKIYLKYSFSDSGGAHYIFDRSEGHGDWKFSYSDLKVRIYNDPYTYMFGEHMRYFFLHMRGDFDRYDMSNIHITAQIKYNNLPYPRFSVTETFINYTELPDPAAREPRYIRKILDDIG